MAIKIMAGVQKKISRAQRISIVTEILGGGASRAEIYHRHSIEETELNSWIRQHGGDRVVDLDEFRMPRELHSSCYSLWLQKQRLESLLKSKTQELCGLRQLAKHRGIL